MALIVPDLGVIVTAAPGTGSTSLRAAFAAAGGRPVLDQDVVVDGEAVVDAKHATAAELVAAGVLDADHGMAIVTSTRNPFDYWSAEWERTRTRWVHELRDRSSWVYRVDGAVGRIVDAVTMAFAPWLAQALGPAAEAGRRTHLNPDHIAEADVVVRMEHLSADLAAAGVDDVAVPHLNVTPRAQSYWQHYDAGARALVTEVHAPDLERFGYAF